MFSSPDVLSRIVSTIILIGFLNKALPRLVNNVGWTLYSERERENPFLLVGDTISDGLRSKKKGSLVCIRLATAGICAEQVNGKVKRASRSAARDRQEPFYRAADAAVWGDLRDHAEIALIPSLVDASVAVLAD